MNKISQILIVLVSILSGLCASAAPLSVKVTDGAGISTEFLLADTPTVAYTTQGLCITAGTVQVVYPADATYVFTLSDISGIADAVDQKVILTTAAGQATVQGLAPGVVVSAYDANGRMLAQSTAAADGSATISLASMRGLIIISTPMQSFKLIR